MASIGTLLAGERRVRPPQSDRLHGRPDVRVAAKAGAEWGVLSLDELRACGLSRDAVAVRVARGSLHPLHRGVYAVGHRGLPLEGRFLAAVKACGPDAVLSHFSAAALLGFVSWDGRHPEVTVLREGTRVHRGIRVHRTRVLDPPDVARYRGIAITSPARTLVDLASALDIGGYVGPSARRNRFVVWSYGSSPGRSRVSVRAEARATSE